MRIEVRASDGAACENCGSHELLFTASTNAALEAELKAHFEQPLRIWNLVKRRQYRNLCREIDRVCGELRERTVKV
jgi:hypothetical protein